MSIEKVEHYKAIQEWAKGNDVYFIYKGDSYDLYKSVLGIEKINNINILLDSPEESIKLEHILGADWYVVFK